MKLINATVKFNCDNETLLILLSDGNPNDIFTHVGINFIFENVDLLGLNYNDGTDYAITESVLVLKTSISDQFKALNAANLTYHLSESHFFLTFNPNIKNVLPQMKKEIEAQYDKNKLLELVMKQAKSNLKEEQRKAYDMIKDCDDAISLLEKIGAE